MRYLVYLCLLGLLILVTACRHHAQVTASGEVHAIFPSSWRIQGKLGIQTDTDSGSVAIDWQQQHDRYNIRVNAPFGQGSAHITGDLQWMTIRQTGRQSAISAAPGQRLQQFLQDTLGWPLPIDDLRYWVRGMPNHNKVVDRPVYSEQGLLIMFQQADWSISVNRHRLMGRWLLPRRINIRRDEVKLTLAIREWQFPQS